MAPTVDPIPVTRIVVPVSRWSCANAGPERSRRTRRRLLLAAAGEFDRNGYHGASLSDILASADLTKGALYFHFDSKRALATALLDEVVRSWDDLVADIAGRGLDPLWRLLVETDAFVSRWMYDPLVRGVSRALADPDLAVVRRTWFDDWEAMTLARLTAAREACALHEDVDPRLAGRYVTAVTAGHYLLAGDDTDLWTRVSESWEGLLPRIACPQWVERWRSSPWTARPAPDPAAYRSAREP